MQVLHTFYLVWALIASGLAQPDLFLDDSSVDEAESNTFLTNDVDELLPIEPISDTFALTDPTFLAESPDQCLSVLPPTGRIRRAEPDLCHNPDDGSTEVENSATAEVVQEYWCGSPGSETFANVAVCHTEEGDKMSSEHFLQKLQGPDFSLSFYTTLFQCTLSKMHFGKRF